MSLIVEIQEKIDPLEKSHTNLITRGKDWVAKEYMYKTELHKKIMLERANSMPITMLSSVCKNCPEVAMYKMGLDKAEVLYKAEQEKINILKLQIRILDNQLSREWEQAGKSRY